MDVAEKVKGQGSFQKNWFGHEGLIQVQVSNLSMSLKWSFQQKIYIFFPTENFHEKMAKESCSFSDLSLYESKASSEILPLNFS